jgi:uncharacterized repeat protein (TIGR04076 family)
MTIVYSLEEKRIASRHLPIQYRAGDVYLFTSGAGQPCTKCRKIIPSMLEHIIQRRKSDPEGPGWNDHYHMNCCPNWLLDAVSEVMNNG